MTRKGFALFEIVIVLGALLLIGGGFYFKGLQDSKNKTQIGTAAIQKARKLQQQSQEQATQEEDIIDQLNDSSSITTQ